MLEDFRANVLKTHPGLLRYQPELKVPFFSKFEMFDVQIKVCKGVHLKKKKRRPFFSYAKLFRVKGFFPVNYVTELTAR